ncbi:MAG: hypothetical protein K1X89_03520 [Myxococcaceae bacterium]|nr:hypothetical protein [Myxococcaceae bacterium]
MRTNGRILALVAVLGLTACPLPKKCQVDSECSPDGVCTGGICFLRPDGGTGGGSGGAGGGGATGGGMGGGGVDPCLTVDCAPNTFCVSDGGAFGCIAGFTELAFTSPDAGAVYGKSREVAVEVQLTRDGRTSLPFPGAVALESPVAVTLGAVGGGRYAGKVDAGVVSEGPVTLRASFDAGFAVLTATRQVVSDQTAPVVTLSLSPAPLRRVGTVSEGDPAANYAFAYRRDEKAEVRVEASEPVVVTAASLTGLDAGFTSLASCQRGCDAGVFCACFEVDWAAYPLNDFRATYALAVKPVEDLAGNASAPSAPVTARVTRWKWASTLTTSGGTIQSPAVDGQGNVVTGEAALNQGRLFVMSPFGDDRALYDAGVGAIVTAPVIAPQHVYVGAKNGTAGGLFQFSLDGISEGQVCVATGRDPTGTLALFDAGMEALTSVTQQGHVLAGLFASSNCVQAGSSAPPATGSQYQTVATGSTLFYASGTSSALSRNVLSAGSWGASPTSNSTPLFTKGLALFGSTVAGGGGGPTVGGVYALKADGSLVNRADYPAGTSSPAGIPIVIGTTAAPILVYGNQNGDLIRASYTAGDPGTFADAGFSAVKATAATLTAPVLGADGTIYTVDASGGVYAYTNDLSTRLWTLPVGTIGSVNTSPALDTARMGTTKDCSRPGTLYIPSSGDGHLYAIIVDSKGLSGTAPWPKFQRDDQNTGNPDFPLGANSCP